MDDASHRVNFDTLTPGRVHVRKLPFTVVYSPVFNDIALGSYTASTNADVPHWRPYMDAQNVTKPIANRSVRPLAKTRIVSARVTETEYIALENHAWTMGKTMGDWTRQSLLHELEAGSRRRLEQHIFTELVGIQLLLMNTLGPLLRGERMSAEQL